MVQTMVKRYGPDHADPDRLCTFGIFTEQNLDAAHIQSFGQLSAQTADAIYPQHEDIPDEKHVPSSRPTFKPKN